MRSVVLKVCVGGDGGVGKTTYLYKYCRNEFLVDTKMTVGVSFLTAKVQIEEYEFNLALWDFGGQDQFRFILKSYVKGAHAGLVFFALDRIQSFLSLDEWCQLLRTEKPDLPLVLIGTKADLEDEDMKIPDEDIQAIMEKYDMIAYIRTSSKTGDGVAEPIQTLVDHVYQGMVAGGKT